MLRNVTLCKRGDRKMKSIVMKKVYFYVLPFNQSERKMLSTTCEYINKWVDNTKRHILQSATVNNVYNDRKGKGLFHLYIHHSFL